MNPFNSLRRPATLVPALLLGALALVPWAAGVAEQPFYVVFFARILIYAIAASALNLALGFGGLVSLGHALFLGIGAYSVAIPAYHGIDNGWLHLAVCVAACGLVGLLTGAISLRTTGIGFIMITLAFAQMGYFVFVSLKQYGGDDGTPISATSRFFGLDLGQPGVVYAVAFILLCLVIWWSARLRVAPFGMVLRGARQNPRRINAIGLRGKRYQLAAYVMSAVLCGLAGMLLANLTAFASPATLSWMVSGDLIVMIVLGGLGTVCGPLLGAVVFMGAEEVLKMITESWAAIFGLAIFLVALLRSAGLMGLLEKLAPRRTAPLPAVAVKPVQAVEEHA
ncbi:branched-chain amino acid transport system permease protein [Duganella sp. SG902]|uniref:branched-chain amino acid ABC transporter permease n=1 Tax=Duganella sp. SG902 TaxID=2587016 RepID=UPI00159DF9C8|nr:branched-chain amino acid ABC transporter permease [Duganella sp. SG902]NVM78423.1 branched-chain amino acid transport system permease protein [Duganella sp. SG902]